jgi:hypothetical protein
VAVPAKKIEFSPKWGDLDDQFHDPENYALEDIFDQMVSRQGGGVTPCPEAQELIDQWTVDDDRYDYVQHWRGAVARRQPGIAPVPAEVPAGPEFLNDAEIRGTDNATLADFLAKDAAFMIGEMWGMRDRRNTQDKDWKTTTMSWGAWAGGGESTKNAPAWGFSRHPVGKDKAGTCVVLGSSVGGARKAKAMDEMYAMGLDIDSGAKLDEVLDIVEAKNLLCFVYTSFNHGKRGIELKRDDVLRKLQITRDPEESEIRQFLREFDKNRYEETFIAECTISDQKHQTADGVKIVLDTPPLEKFRLIFPLAEPVKLIDLAGTQQGALDLWEDKITGLARNVLGVHFDTSCTDPSRLFYTARHPKDAAEWRSVIVMGEPLRFSDVDPFKKSIYTANREVNAFTMAGGDIDKDRPPMAVTPSGASLNEWHTRFKSRFMIADLLETLCSDKIVHAGNEASGHVHVECPFEHEHTTSGGTATMAVNCIDSPSDYWTMFCHHDACQGRHKLQFLEEMLRQGWFEESAINNLDSGFLLDPFALLPEEIADKTKTPEERAACFTTESPEADIRNFIRELFRDGVDLTTQVNVTATIAENTNHGRPTIKKFWKELGAVDVHLV